MTFKGMGLKKVLVVSEQDWHNDHYMMSRLLQRSGGLDKSYFYFASLGHPNLVQQIHENGITAVVGMGEKVLQKLLGEKDILRWRGRTITDWMGTYLIPTFAPHKLLHENPNTADISRLKAMGIPQLMNPPRFQGTWMLDMQWALQVAKNGFKRKSVDYLVDPSPEDFNEWARGYFRELALDPTLYLSWDIETPYKQKAQNEDEFEEAEFDNTILRVSFSYKEFTAVSVIWAGAYLETINKLLASIGPKVGWNFLTFDIPVVTSVGSQPRGEAYDYMDGWHVYQSDLPKGLEFVTSYATDLLPWKHLSNSEPGLYSCIDADAALRNAKWIEAKLKSTGQWNTFLNQYVRLMPAMHRAGIRGNAIDIPKRDELRDEFDGILQQEIAEVQPLVPRQVKPRKIWLTPPHEGWNKFSLEPDSITRVDIGDKDFDRVAVKDTIKVCTACNQIATNKTDHYANTKGEPKRDKAGQFRIGKKGNVLYESIKNPCKLAEGVIEERPGIRYEYHEVLPFNPNSTEQLKGYARFYNHSIGQNKKDAEKEAFDAGHIKSLIKSVGNKFPIYAKTLTIHKLKKTLGTYIYNPDEWGLIHTTYKNAPSTPRFSSANVNLQNVPKKEDNYFALRAREQIVARPKYRFVQGDSSAIEALIQGWWMNDVKYMELSTQSVHAWVVAQQLGLEWVGDEEQVSFLKKNHKSLYDKMKVTNYLTNFGGGDYLLWKTFPEAFPSRADAKNAQDMLYAQLPKLKEYHHWVRTKAQKEGYLELPGWRARHYYYDVFSTDSNTGKIKYGKDAKRCVAFFPQGCAGSFMRDNSLLLAYGDEAANWLGIEPLGLGDGYLKWMPANFVVHDGYTLEVPNGHEDEAAEAMEKVLTRPIHQLGGLLVGCEIDISPVGGNWAPEGRFLKPDGTYHYNPNGLKTVKTVRMPIVAPQNNLRLAA